MSKREIVFAKNGTEAVFGAEKSGGEQADEYKDRLLKYIPAEVISLYLALTGILASVDQTPNWLPWAIFGLGIVATYLYMRRIAEVSNNTQLLISAGAFIVWAFAMGEPFSSTTWYQPYYAALVLPIYTFFVPLIQK